MSLLRVVVAVSFRLSSLLLFDDVVAVVDDVVGMVLYDVVAGVLAVGIDVADDTVGDAAYDTDVHADACADVVDGDGC